MSEKVRQCPYCNAKPAYPTRVETTAGGRREYPTTFTCGTVTSPDWGPPIRGENCKSNNGEPK